MKDNSKITKDNEMSSLYDNIRLLIENSRDRVYRTVNTEMINLYWHIGKMIVEKQGGLERAKYGDYLIENVSSRLTKEYGSSFSSTNLKRMRKFYIYYPISQTSSNQLVKHCFTNSRDGKSIRLTTSAKLGQHCRSNSGDDNSIRLTMPGESPIPMTLSPQLAWSHYLELIKIKDKNKRNFYTVECIKSNWTVRELRRQRTTLLYERLTNGKTKAKTLELSKMGHEVTENKDIIKDPFVLEFLDIKENTDYLETDLEKKILEHLKEFLLELGRGFTFVGNQARITIDDDHFYPDLVFYNRVLRCFVIIDLKLGRVSHKDIGQMQMYVNYYDREIKSNEENATIGILLSTDKNETVVKYTLPEDNKTIFSSEFRLTIPTEKELINLIETEKENIRLMM